MGPILFKSLYRCICKDIYDLKSIMGLISTNGWPLFVASEPTSMLSGVTLFHQASIILRVMPHDKDEQFICMAIRALAPFRAPHYSPHQYRNSKLHSKIGVFKMSKGRKRDAITTVVLVVTAAAAPFSVGGRRLRQQSTTSIRNRVTIKTFSILL